MNNKWCSHDYSSIYILVRVYTNFLMLYPEVELLNQEVFMSSAFLDNIKPFKLFKPFKLYQTFKAFYAFCQFICLLAVI